MSNYHYIADLADIEVRILKALGSGRLQDYEIAHLAGVFGAFLADTINGAYEDWEYHDFNRRKLDDAYENGYDVGYRTGRADLKYEMENPDERR